MNLDQILTRYPVNAAARVAISQSGCSENFDATLKDLGSLKDRLVAEFRDMKKKIGITNLGQHVAVKRLAKKMTDKGEKLPAELNDYIEMGRHIALLNDAYAQILKAHGTPQRTHKARIYKSGWDFCKAEAA